MSLCVCVCVCISISLLVSHTHIHTHTHTHTHTLSLSLFLSLSLTPSSLSGGQKKWLDKDKSLGYFGIDEREVLKCEERPVPIEVRLKGSPPTTMNVLFR